MYKRNSNLIHLFFSRNLQRKGLFIMSKKKLVAFFSASGTTKSSRDDCRGSKS